MTLKEAIERWEAYLKSITDILEPLSDDIQCSHFADSSDIITLICLHSQLCTARSTAQLGLKLMKSVLDETTKAGVKHNE